MSKSDSNRLGSSSGTSFGGGTGEDIDFAKLVVKHHLVSSGEIKQCFAAQKRLTDEEQEHTPLCELLVKKGFITASQAHRVLSELEKRPSQQQFPGYQLLDKLGKGAMATVYKARQLSLDRVVAIKVLPKRYSENAEFVDRFYREGKAAARLNHRNIVQAFDVGEAGGYHYFVMEYVDGYTVHNRLADNSRYTERETFDIIVQIADALAHAHACGLIHRDVKPKNIMISKDGTTAKLADMGLARDVSDTRVAQSEAGRAYGTPYYIAPEQIRGEVDIDFRADIYSLGATFYHMVTGQVPFDGPNPTAVMLKHLREELIPPDHINQELSIGCAEVIEVMMAKDREDRYQSTEDLLADLRAVSDGRLPIHARAIFDITELMRLEREGEPADQTSSISSALEAHLPRWKAAVLILIIFLFLSLLINIVLVLK